MPSNDSFLTSNHLKIGFTYDSRSDWMARGFSAEQCAEFESEETVESIAAALRTRGMVEMIGGLKSLAKKLVSSEADWDVVFNICEGYGTLGREAQVPAILEAWGIPFTFSDSATLALCLDKAKTKMVLEHYGIPTAPFACIPPRNSWPSPDFYPLSIIENSAHREALNSFPLFVKPSSVSTGIGISQANKVTNHEQLAKVLEDISTRYSTQTILIERFLAGREFTVGIIGTGADAYAIGVYELVFLKDNPQFPINTTIPYDSHDPAVLELDVYGHELKHQWTPNPQHVNMDLADPIARAAADIALKAWQVLGCRDGGRVDVRHDKKGLDAVPNFIEVNPIAGLAPNWSDLPRLAKANGIDFERLLGLVINSALKRHNY
ncbi:hypothetical protein BDZ97DRAFT_1751846 [Flammula alnicola]|nr:hypothetical protein BDZ97DRAFT_1751846 [Flammula alnicola]